MDTSLSKLREMVKDREACRVAVHGVAKSDMTERMNKNNKPRCQAIWEGSVTVKSLTVEFWLDALGAFRKGMVDRANGEELKSD